NLEKSNPNPQLRRLYSALAGALEGDSQIFQVFYDIDPYELLRGESPLESESAGGSASDNEDADPKDDQALSKPVGYSDFTERASHQTGKGRKNHSSLVLETILETLKQALEKAYQRFSEEGEDLEEGDVWDNPESQSHITQGRLIYKGNKGTERKITKFFERYLDAINEAIDQPFEYKDLCLLSIVLTLLLNVAETKIEVNDEEITLLPLNGEDNIGEDDQHDFKWFAIWILGAVAYRLRNGLKQETFDSEPNLDHVRDSFSRVYWITFGLLSQKKVEGRKYSATHLQDNIWSILCSFQQHQLCRSDIMPEEVAALIERLSLKTFVSAKDVETITKAAASMTDKWKNASDLSEVVNFTEGLRCFHPRWGHVVIRKIVDLGGRKQMTLSHPGGEWGDEEEDLILMKSDDTPVQVIAGYSKFYMLSSTNGKNA
ncbi:MAG: hypothetical protein AB7H97_14330, partial [Pseudobdellovibrionaceae bacterium]